MVTHCALQLGARIGQTYRRFFAKHFFSSKNISECRTLSESSSGHAFRAYSSEGHGWRTFSCASAQSKISNYTKLHGRFFQKLMSSAHKTQDEILPLASRDHRVHTDDDLTTKASDEEIEYPGTAMPWQVTKTLRAFNGRRPVEEAETPPSAWYTDAGFAEYEFEHVFGRGWQAVGHVNQVEKPGFFFTGRVGKVRYVICKDEQGQVQAFHNVCRHHAAAVASGTGCTQSFVCPYHGWTYGLDGRLHKATRLAGIRNFSARENGLVPIRTATWGPFVLISLGDNKAMGEYSTIEEAWLGSAAPVLVAAGINTSLQHVATRDYFLNCNWKVYCDNYLDGGYHVPHAHRGLAACLDLQSYTTSLLERVSIQSCRAFQESGPDGNGRLGNIANYAFVYPNFMINRYGPWMDTNLVLPVTPTQCRVVFDWFLDPSLVHDKDFIESSVADSEIVQKEDITLCEDVQIGLISPAYDVGRYVPRVEQAMHHFHCLLNDDLHS